MKRRCLGLVLFVGLAGSLALSLPVAGDEQECIDHGVIDFGGQELGAAQCGDVVIFSDATWVNVPDGYVLVNLSNEFYFYAPSLDSVLDLDLADRRPLDQPSP